MEIHINNIFISIIIPTYNRKSEILLTLDSISKLDYKNHEVIIVDDCSTDNTIEEIKKFNCKIIKLEKNSGPGIARNIGVKSAKSQIIQFLDSDVLVPPNLLNIVNAKFQDSSIDCLIGTYSEQSPCNNIAGQFKNLFIRYTFINLPENPHTIHSCITAIRKNVFEKSGGFDERLTNAGVEDVIFGHELAKQGFKIKFAPDYSIQHLKCFSFKELVRNDFNKGLEFISILLENKEFLKMIRDKNQPHSNRNFALTIPIAYLLFLSLILFYISGKILFFISFAVCSIIYFLKQYNFIHYLIKIKGIAFSIKSIPYLLLNSYVFGFATIFGIIKHKLKYKSTLTF